MICSSKVGIKTLDTGAYHPVPKDMSDKLKTTLKVGQLKADNMEKMKDLRRPGHRAGQCAVWVDAGVRKKMRPRFQSFLEMVARQCQATCHEAVAGS